TGDLQPAHGDRAPGRRCSKQSERTGQGAPRGRKGRKAAPVTPQPRPDTGYRPDLRGDRLLGDSRTPQGPVNKGQQDHPPGAYNAGQALTSTREKGQR